MSPFSRHLVELRRRHGLRQGELASKLGCPQSYLSAIEGGLKGPPTAEFVERLSKTLSLPVSETRELVDVLEASQLKLAIALDANEDIFWLLKDLREQLPALSPLQVRMIRDIIRLRDPQIADQTLSLKQQVMEGARM